MAVVGERKREAVADVRVRSIFSQRSTRSKAIILIERDCGRQRGQEEREGGGYKNKGKRQRS